MVSSKPSTLAFSSDGQLHSLGITHGFEEGVVDQLGELPPYLHSSIQAFLIYSVYRLKVRKDGYFYHHWNV